MFFKCIGRIAVGSELAIPVVKLGSKDSDHHFDLVIENKFGP